MRYPISKRLVVEPILCNKEVFAILGDACGIIVDTIAESRSAEFTVRKKSDEKSAKVQALLEEAER